MTHSLSQAKAKLSQWDALMLESVKALGWPKDELIQKVLEGNLPQDDSKFHFDYTLLTSFAKKNEELFRSAVQDGYQIKYNTIRGIHSWILVALKQEGVLSLEAGEEAVSAALTDSEAELLSSVLSFGWALSPAVADEGQALQEGRKSYQIKPAASTSL
ncbi:hypothetical protein ACX93W_23820 [Paenibacillus sp. CAU 1782]